MGVLSIKEKPMDENKECCCSRTKVRSDAEYRDLITRLNRIEGQIRGIRGMVEKDAYCIDILGQVAAVSGALNSFTKILLSSHIRSCVAEDVREGNEEKLDELVRTLQKLMK
jgi:DNA-binding FrmR family transcriptional regulator